MSKMCKYLWIQFTCVRYLYLNCIIKNSKKFDLYFIENSKCTMVLAFFHIFKAKYVFGPEAKCHFIVLHIYTHPFMCRWNTLKWDWVDGWTDTMCDYLIWILCFFFFIFPLKKCFVKPKILLEVWNRF